MIKYYLFIHRSTFLRFLSCPTPILSFPGSKVPLYTVCVLCCNISYFALFQFGFLCLMEFAFIPSVLHNSRYGQWVSFSETLTLRSHSFVVITISDPATAYTFFPCVYHFVLIYILSFFPLSALKLFCSISSWPLSLLHGILYIIPHICCCTVHSLIQRELALFLIFVFVVVVSFLLFWL